MPHALRTVLFLLVGVGAFMVASSISQVAYASNPEVVTMSPPGVQRGVPTEVTISGARLGDAKQLLFFTPGIEATNIAVVDDNNIKVTITASADCPCDLHAFRVFTSTGLSNLRLFGVGAMPIVTEVEPNSDFTLPQVVPMNHTVHGTVQSEDVDYFALDLTKGQTLTVELEGLRLSYMNDFFDPFVAILDAKRFELARCDDLPLVQQDGICSMIAPEDGRYIVQVRESSFGGNDRARYRLHLGSYPRPLAMYPAGGKPGQTFDVTCIDSQGQTWQQSVSIPSTAQNLYRAWATRDSLVAPSPNYLRVFEGENVLETPDNNDPNKASISATLPVAFNGILETDNDVDWFGFTAKKDQQLEIKVYSRKGIRSPVDGVLMINKKGGAQLAANDDTGGPDPLVSFKVPEDGDYVVGIRDHLGFGGPANVYRIEVALPAPSVAATVNEMERWVSQTINIPAGSRMAVEANLVRRSVGGEGALTIPDLPPGLTLVPTPVAADLTMVPMMLQAAPDAPQQGKLVDLVASLKLTPEQTLNGHLEQRNQIIRGQNNVDVWGFDGDRLAVAVTEPAPFTIQVNPPQVPLVRDGSLELVVKAVRNEGFTKPINLRLLSNPPGVGASTSIAIPGDQSEALIPLTANGSAQIRTWPITVLATYDNGRGSVTIASEFVNLEVADSLFEFQFNKTVAEQGKSAEIFVGIKAKRPVVGTTEIEVLGLPPGTTSAQPKLTFTEGMEQLVFPLTVPMETRQGNYKTVVCRAVVKTDHGLITQTNGAAEVQVDVPLPAPTQAPAPMPAPVAAAAPTAAPPKPLTRLEQLRQQRENARGKQD